MTRMGDAIGAANAPLRGLVHAAAVEWIGFPSASLPSLPSFRLEVPDGWHASNAPGALFVVAPAGPSDVTARVEWLRVASSTPLRDLAAAYFARTARRHPDVAVAVQKLGRLRDRPVYLRGTTMTAADGRRIAQLQAFLMVPLGANPELADLLVVVGTCAEVDAPRLVPEFVRLAASIEVNAAGSGVGLHLTEPLGNDAPQVDPLDPFDLAPPARSA
jgi:hypothetical protein